MKLSIFQLLVEFKFSTQFSRLLMRGITLTHTHARTCAFNEIMVGTWSCENKQLKLKKETFCLRL
jgi:hypothetical protein